MIIWSILTLQTSSNCLALRLPRPKWQTTGHLRTCLRCSELLWLLWFGSQFSCLARTKQITFQLSRLAVCLNLISKHSPILSLHSASAEAKVLHKSFDTLWCNARSVREFGLRYVFHPSLPHDPSTSAHNQSKIPTNLIHSARFSYCFRLESWGTPQPSEATARIKGSKALSSWPSMCQPASR